MKKSLLKTLKSKEEKKIIHFFKTRRDATRICKTRLIASRIIVDPLSTPVYEQELIEQQK